MDYKFKTAETDGEGKGNPFAIEDLVIASWAEAELLAWQSLTLSRDDAEARLQSLVARNVSFCLFRIEEGRVSVDEALAKLRPNLLDRQDPLGLRALSYLDLLSDAFETYGANGSGYLAVCLDDIYPSGVSAPAFCFQKKVGVRGILLPDVDFMNWHYYAVEDNSLIDLRSYDEKEDRAIFVGSTTGSQPLTSKHVLDLSNERLRAGVYFRGKEDVVFDLPRIVQCDSTETVQLVQQLKIQGRLWSWPEQLRFRYLISMDGNGATCSRVVVALQSNSVLLKYASPYQLYYFHGMKPWQHYIPIIEDRDIDDFMQDAGILEPLLANVSSNGTIFARTYLTRLSVLRYTAEVATAYLRIFGDAGAGLQPRDQSSFLDLYAHIANVGTCFAKPGRWVGETRSPGGIEGLCVTASRHLDPTALVCSVVDIDGETSEAFSGQFVGSTGRSKPLRSVRFDLRGSAADQFILRYDARFADGRELSGESGDTLQGDSPLVDIRIGLRRR